VHIVPSIGNQSIIYAHSGFLFATKSPVLTREILLSTFSPIVLILNHSDTTILQLLDYIYGAKINWSIDLFPLLIAAKELQLESLTQELMSFINGEPRRIASAFASNPSEARHIFYNRIHDIAPSLDSTASLLNFVVASEWKTDFDPLELMRSLKTFATAQSNGNKTVCHLFD
jgi:hypothetical protein